MPMPHAHQRRDGSSRLATTKQIAAALLVVGGLAACGGPAGPAPTAVAPSTPPAATPRANETPPAPTMPTAFSGIGSPVARPGGEIGPVVWASAVDPTTKAPVARATAFPRDAATIYAVVPVIRLAPNARLTVTWSYNDTSLDAFTQTVVANGRPGARWIEFHLTRSSDRPWPTGTYAVEVRLDDGVVQTASVTVGEPA
jgi:hypothetical protein